MTLNTSRTTPRTVNTTTLPNSPKKPRANKLTGKKTENTHKEKKKKTATKILLKSDKNL